MDWNQHSVRAYQPVERQKVERRGTIQNNESIVNQKRAQESLKPVFTMIRSYQLNSGSGKILVRRDDIQSLDLRLLNDFFGWLVQDQRVIESPARGIFRKADRRSGICLRVTIDKERRLVSCSETGGEVNRSCSFTDSTLLIRDRDNSCQISPEFLCGENLAKYKFTCKLFHVERLPRLWKNSRDSVIA